MRKRNIVQIAASQSEVHGDGPSLSLYALSDDNKLFQLAYDPSSKKTDWIKIKDLPQGQLHELNKS